MMLRSYSLNAWFFMLLVFPSCVDGEGSATMSMKSVSLSSEFVADVIRPNNERRDLARTSLSRQRRVELEQSMNDDLLSHAVPLHQYKQHLETAHKGLVPQIPSRFLKEEDEGGDDFYLDEDLMYSFGGFSIKYAQCQPVQYFSEDAISAGEHSPMVTEDIVVLRLCPQKSCSTSATYGCHYNYAEYAMSLSTYLSIMLKWSSKKLQSTCKWCEACQNDGGRKRRTVRRQLEEDPQDEVVEGEAEAAVEEDVQVEEADDIQELQGDDNAASGDDEEYMEEEQANKAQQAEDAGDDYSAGDDGSSTDDTLSQYEANCPYYSTYCSNYESDCNPDYNAGDDAVSYMDYDDILDSGYLTCTEISYNNYPYYIRPRCDGYNGTIQMAIYYDQFCVQSVGSELSLASTGISIRQDMFEDFYAYPSCIDCSVDDESSPPYFDYNGPLCNKIHYVSAKCTSAMSYNLFDGYESSSSECSYIESIRYGTYDETGKLSAASITNGITWTTEVSKDQKAMLIISSIICITLILYACYIHHSMTNLLIKSLSHRELLPPSRHRAKGMSSSRRTTMNSSGIRGTTKGDDEWDKPTIV